MVPRFPSALAGALVAALAVLPVACIRKAPAPAAAPDTRPKAEFVPVAEADAAQVKNPHAYQGKPLCQRCHEAGAPGVKTDPIALCSGCHDPAYMRHPFRVAAAPATAAGLPLMPNRIIACHTCHDPHDVKARRGGLRMQYSELCKQCHEKHTRSSAPPPGPEHQPPPATPAPPPGMPGSPSHAAPAPAAPAPAAPPPATPR